MTPSLPNVTSFDIDNCSGPFVLFMLGSFLVYPALPSSNYMAECMLAVQWSRIPPFIREGVERFPFHSHHEAIEFFALLVDRVASRLRSLPSADNCPQSTDRRAEWSWDLRAEMVSNFVMREQRYQQM